MGLGHVCIDHVGRVPVYPSEDSKMEMEALYTSCGGPAATALAALSRWGVAVSLLGCVSDDAFGIRISECLKEEGVDAACLKTVPGHDSQFAFIAVTAEGGKRTVFWKRSTVPPITPGEIHLDLFPKAQILHLDGLMPEAAKEAAAQASTAGMTVVMDAGTIRDGIPDLVSQVDVLIASETFADPLVGKNASPEKALINLVKMGPRQVVMTLGANGSIGYLNGRIVHQPALPVISTDTTGAGDVYHGGYIYGLLQGWPMPRCMAFASVAAALKCKNGHGWRGIPKLVSVRENMANP